MPGKQCAQRLTMISLIFSSNYANRLSWSVGRPIGIFCCASFASTQLPASACNGSIPRQTRNQARIPLFHWRRPLCRPLLHSGLAGVARGECTKVTTPHSGPCNRSRHHTDIYCRSISWHERACRRFGALASLWAEIYAERFGAFHTLHCRDGPPCACGHSIFASLRAIS
jgi:hypothetical protein